MITYVNTVFVGTGKELLASLPTTYSASNVNKFVVTDGDGTVLTTTNAAKADTMKIGFITNKTYTDKNGKHSVIKWSNVIKKADLKSYTADIYSSSKESEEKIVIDFTKMTTAVANELAAGNKRVILRLTFKDLPTRYRKWTESYEYVTGNGDNATKIAEGLKKQVENNYKRARVSVAAEAGILTITALPYDDDDVVDSISWANKVRFNANVWYTDPLASGFASKNKYAIKGVTITKTPGKQYAASTKLVRDREAMSFGYMGILNRGEGTWPIIKPDMNVQLDKNYDYFVLEFENSYRSADDLTRKTKQTVECYDVASSAGLTALKAIVNAFVTSSDGTLQASSVIENGHEG